MDKIRKSFDALRTWCEIEHFKGWDPYDGLNAEIFKYSPFNWFKWTRLIWMQAFKHFPLNLRRIAMVPKQENPAGLGVFLSGYCKLYSSGLEKNELVLKRIKHLAERLLVLQTPGWSGACWGYNFPWQARAFYLPRYYPNIVATVHISYALLDAYEICRDEKYLSAARSACDFILKDLNRTENEDGDQLFSYSPKDKSGVFNASLLGSGLLARVGGMLGDQELTTQAASSIRFCEKEQNEDGSWAYGKLDFHQWIDSFHTGYNLEAMNTYVKYSQDHQPETVIRKGLDYYLNNFFEKSGFPKYYNNSKYPLDLNPPAQLILTLHSSNDLNSEKEKIEKVLHFVIDTMQSDKGYFYFQDKGRYKIKIPYMRWTQAWMFYAMAVYLSADSEKN